MHLTYVFKLKPTKAQRARLDEVLELQRELYNAALEERCTAWRRARHRITKFDQTRSLTAIRTNDPAFGDISVMISRWTLGKLDLAFAAFFKRSTTKRGSAGFPRFRSKARWRSFGFSEWCGVRLKNKRITMKGVGTIRVHMHRDLPSDATPKSCTITRQDRTWRVAIQVAVTDFIGPHTRAGTAIGIDLNIVNRATTSEGSVIKNPRHLGQKLADIKRAARHLARCRVGSRGFRKAKRTLAAHHAKTLRRRKTAMHQASAKIARENSLIAVERLLVSNMSRSAKGSVLQPGKNICRKRGLNRALLDVAPATFKKMLLYKAERAGGCVIEVAPHGTSRDCSACGAPVPKSLKERAHRCPHCGLTMDRDQNAARNILSRAQAVVGLRDANVGQNNGYSIVHRSSVVPESSLLRAIALEAEALPIGTPTDNGDFSDRQHGDFSANWGITSV